MLPLPLPLPESGYWLRSAEMLREVLMRGQRCASTKRLVRSPHHEERLSAGAQRAARFTQSSTKRRRSLALCFRLAGRQGEAGAAGQRPCAGPAPSGSKAAGWARPGGAGAAGRSNRLKRRTGRRALQQQVRPGPSKTKTGRCGPMPRNSINP
ncbi:hypothetical protein NDU88_003059 [Pleurodeles waltl]|uniref:Uncharacterized protein n=1 Tax=Pleurodeles waltl TaxID=8319 RepID=A0AAV7QAQ6_PLEWA|nr:hypothetical protein NDU88_003059 [Pleurodeles waltl]